MTTIFKKENNMYFPVQKDSFILMDELPADTFVVKVNSGGVFYLEETSKFELPTKMYGDPSKLAERFLNTYKDRSSNTGVGLAGEKGTGKTMLAKAISVKARAAGIPTVLINTALYGNSFNSFIQSITQDCVVIFDEFEKVYDREDQQKVLTLLDGVLVTKKLFVITCNDKYALDGHISNRPGRLFYFKEYFGIEEETIKEYCGDILNEDLKVHTSDILKIASTFISFNFDMLKAIVEEVNRYGESPFEVIKLINASPSNEPATHTFVVSLFVDNIMVDAARVYPKTIEANPLDLPNNTSIQFEVETKDSVGKPEKEKDYETEYSIFGYNDLKSIEPNGRYTFINSDGHKLILTKEKRQTISYLY